MNSSVSGGRWRWLRPVLFLRACLIDNVKSLIIFRIRTTPWTSKATQPFTGRLLLETCDVSLPSRGEIFGKVDEVSRNSYDDQSGCVE